MEHNRIALIASLDTKLQETLYAKHEIESCGGQGLIIDISTKTLVDAGDAVGPADILMPVDDIGLVAISHFFHVFLADSGQLFIGQHIVRVWI